MSQEPSQQPPRFAPPSEPLPPLPESTPAPFHRPYGQPYPERPHDAHGHLPATADDPMLAEWWQRLVARIVDTVVVMLVTSPIWIWYSIWYVQKLPTITPADQPATDSAMRQMLVGEAKLLGVGTLVGLAVAIVMFGYDWIQHAGWGQTLGKRIMKIKVVARADRAPITSWPAAKRAAVYALVPQIPLVGNVFALLNELWLLWDKPHRQCLHDKVADTVVIKTKPDLIA